MAFTACQLNHKVIGTGHEGMLALYPTHSFCDNEQYDDNA
jgi:hypothetical protein